MRFRASSGRICNYLLAVEDKNYVPLMSPMANPSITFQHCADKLRADGTALVRLRAYHAGRSAYMGTGIYIKAKHWNKRTRCVRQSCEFASLYNRRLDDLRVRGMAAAFETSSAADVIAELTGGGSSFSGYAQTTIKAMKADGAYWRWRKAEGVMKKVHAAIGEPVTWGALTPEALTRIERYMRDKGNGANTIQAEMGRLRAIVNNAVRDGIIRTDDSPFVRYRMPRGVPTERRSLTIDEALLLADLDLKAGTRLRVTRDAWMLAYFGAGVRVSDLLLLGANCIDGDRLKYRAQKTNTLHSVQLPPRALDILKPYRAALHKRLMQSPNTHPSPYLFDALMKQGDDSDKVDVRKRQQTATARMNEALKEIATLAGLDPAGFSTHVSRHSFASRAQRHGNMRMVQKLLGHKKVSTAERYLASLSLDEQDAVTQSMWEDAGV